MWSSTTRTRFTAVIPPRFGTRKALRSTWAHTYPLTKDERIQQLLAENVDGEFEIVQYRVNNYWRGYWLPHPAQCNL